MAGKCRCVTTARWCSVSDSFSARRRSERRQTFGIRSSAKGGLRINRDELRLNDQRQKPADAGRADGRKRRVHKLLGKRTERFPTAPTGQFESGILTPVLTPVLIVHLVRPKPSASRIPGKTTRYYSVGSGGRCPRSSLNLRVDREPVQARHWRIRVCDMCVNLGFRADLTDQEIRFS